MTMTQHRILVPLAPGFEETEAIAIVDVLRRAELDVVTASIGEQQVMGAHGIGVGADCTWEQLDESSVTAIVLPGGMPGTTNLRDDERVIRLLQRLASEGKLTAAICAAPLVLGTAGLLGEGREYTCFPGMAADLAQWGPRSEARVVTSGTVLTSQGPGTAIDFALALVATLVGSERSREVAAGLLVRSAE